MFKHTPGPWRVNRQRIEGGNGLCVAMVQRDPPEADANARLIVKAPAMYDLLRHAIDAFGPAIEDESDINGADTVDWICMFVQAAKNCLEPTPKTK